MKEFDLEKAKAGAPVCTRSGRTARIICWDANAKWDDEKFPIVALIGDDEDGEVAQTYTTDGRMYPNITSDDDLMMAVIKHEGWVLIDPEPHCMAHIYDTRDEAEKDAEREMIDYLAIAHIEWEE